MFLSKLKVTWITALAVTLGLAAAGLGYRVSAGEPRQGGDEIRQTRVVSDELDAMRLEIEALRRGLQATRERVKLLESELQTLKQTHVASSDPRHTTVTTGAWSTSQPTQPSSDVAPQSDTADGRASAKGSKAGGGTGSWGSADLGSTTSSSQRDRQASGANSGRYSRDSGADSRPDNERPTNDTTRPSSNRQGSPKQQKSADAAKEAIDVYQENRDLGGFFSRDATGAASGSSDASARKDPLADAEEALKEVRKQQGNTSASERLERALLRLKDQSRPKDSTRSK